MSIVSNSNLERYVGKQKEWAENRYDLTTNCNYQLTEKANEVSFYPTGNSPLDCTVGFMFTETPPASGEKSPDNPSTITGVNSLTVTRGHLRGILENSYTVDLGDTYYGGSVDLATGTVIVTHKKIVLSGSTSFSSGLTSVFDNCCKVGFYPGRKVKAQASSIDVCTDNFLTYVGSISNNSEAGVYIQSNATSVNFVLLNTITGLSSSSTNEEIVTAINAWFAENPTELIYELATPEIVQLSPIQIFALAQQDKYTPRLNIVYSTGTSVQVGYRKSPIREEYEIQQAIASLGGI